MSGDSATNLRRLIQETVRLDGGRDWPAGSRAHEIGEGIKKNKRYATPSSGHLALPQRGPGVERLRAALDVGIPDVPANLSREAWARLLNMPTLITDTLRAGAGDPSNVTTKQLVLAAVFRSADERLADGEMTHPRFAAKATLTLRLESDGQKRFTTDAWLTADWFDSTRALLAALDADPGIRARAPGSGSQRVDVVFAADRVHWADGTDLYEAVERIAHLAGMRARLLFLSGQNYASTRARLRSEQPTHLVFIGSNGIDEVRQEFEVRNRGAAHILEQNNPTDLVGALYEKIPRIGGIAANLMLYSVPPSAPDRLPDMPSIDAIDCKHVNNRVYVLDSIENVWWTRDDAHHARVQFKTYTLQNDTLHWRADHGADHVVAEGKHKGSGTMTVSLKAATSCGNPRRHLFS